jgi:transcriptional regulator with XRE-family HTH domain
MSVLYENLKKLCDEKGIKGADLCDAIGYKSHNLLTELKSGRKSTLTIEVGIKIAHYFGVSVEHLLSLEEQEIKNSPEEPKLTEGEKMLLSLFRQIPEERQQAFLEMGRLYSDSLKKD